MTTGRRIAGALGAVIFAVPVAAAFTSHAGGSPLHAAAVAIVLLTAWRPIAGVLIVSGLLPLATYIGALSNPSIGSEAVSEILIASALCGAGARRVFDPPARPGRLSAPAVALGAIIALNGAFVFAGHFLITGWTDRLLPDLQSHLVNRYFTDRSGFESLHLAFAWIEGLALAVLAEQAVRDTRRAWPAAQAAIAANPWRRWIDTEPAAVVRMFAAGGAALMAPWWVRLAEISLRQRHPLSAAIAFVRTLRFAPILSDVNAAAALLALYTVAIIWLARRRRWCWPIAAGLGGALWLTGSRGAQLAAIGAVAVLWLASQPGRRARVTIGLAAAAAALALVTLEHGRETQSTSSVAMETRLAMAGVGLHVAAEQPVFGVGLGQFRRVSLHYISPELMTLFPNSRVGENAHNNFIQILAELGALGLAGFLWLITGSLSSVPWRSVMTSGVASPADRDAAAAQLALAGGVAAFLFSALISHPLLITEVMWLFLLTLGMMAGFGDAPSTRATAYSRWIAAACLVLFVIALPARTWRLRQTGDFDGLFIGASDDIRTAEDGVRYRVAPERSAWFVSSAATHLEIPLRLTADSRTPCLVIVDVDGRPANVVETSSPSWSRLALDLRPDRNAPRSRRLVLSPESGRCHLMVGTPPW